MSAPLTGVPFAGDVGAHGPALSVVVPSYNRRGSLELVLAALAAQEVVSPGAFDVIVVLDGSTDDSAAILATWVAERRLPGLRWLLQPNGGQAAARDAGARTAAAPVLLFLDDDVVPERDLVARHLAHHAAGERIAVLGDCEIVRPPGAPLYLQQMWAWWDDVYAARARPGRRPCYVDFCAGNVSLRRDDYLAIGGFDPAFRGYGGEDYDLGYRLLQAGVRFVADRRTRAMHHHRFGGYASFFRTRRHEGGADVTLGRKHPELRAGLRLMYMEGMGEPHDALVAAAFTPRGLSDVALRARIARTVLSARLGDRARWKRHMNALGIYWYARGLYDALGSRQALRAFVEEATIPVQAVDITDGIGEPATDFWVHGPSDVRVTTGGEFLGTVRLHGPVVDPLRAALGDAVRIKLTGAIYLWAERTGTRILPPLPR